MVNVGKYTIHGLSGNVSLVSWAGNCEFVFQGAWVDFSSQARKTYAQVKVENISRII